MKSIYQETVKKYTIEELFATIGLTPTTDEETITNQVNAIEEQKKVEQV